MCNIRLHGDDAFKLVKLSRKCRIFDVVLYRKVEKTKSLKKVVKKFTKSLLNREYLTYDLVVI